MLKTLNTLINMKEVTEWGVTQGVIATHGHPCHHRGDRVILYKITVAN